MIENVDGIDYALQEVWTRAGKMLWLEKVTHDARKTRTFEVLAVLEVPSVEIDEGLQFGAHACKTSRGFDPEVIAITAFEERGVEFRARVHQAWRADRRQGKFLPIAPTGIACLNPGAMDPLPGTIPTCGLPGPGLGAIRGKLIADSPDIVLPLGVSVKRLADDALDGRNDSPPWCDGHADRNGNYELSGLPAGTYVLRAGGGRARPVNTTVIVRAGGPTRVDVHLEPENRVLDCLSDPVCAPLLAPLDSQSRLLLSDEEQLLEAAVRTTIAISGFTARTTESAPEALCVGIGSEGKTGSLPESVLRVVRMRLPAVRQAVDCKVVSSGAGGAVLRAGDNLWAWSYSVQVPAGDAGRASASSSYSATPGDGEGWECEYEHDGSGWRPRLCRGTWIT
jgi:hypothetical protein